MEIAWLEVALGLVLLVLGRKMFWGVVGIIGFLGGFRLATELLAGEPLLAIIVGLVAGIAGVFVALLLQHVAVILAGAAAGGIIAADVMATLNMSPGMPYWVIVVISAVGGGVLSALLFDWALIVISSLAGAELIAGALPLDPTPAVALFVALAMAGMALQAMTLNRETRQMPDEE